MRNLIIALVAVAAVALLAGSAQAGMVTTSTTAPTVDGADVSMLDMTGATGQGKFWTGEGFAAGQTIVTGSAAPQYNLNALTIRYESGGDATKTYEVRVGTLTPDDWYQEGTNGYLQKDISVIGAKSCVHDGDAVAEDYLTFTFDTPFTLSADTEYAVDVRMTDSTVSWRSGIPSVYRGGDNYADGEAYKVIWEEKWGGDLNVARQSTGDWVFHADMEAVVPEPATMALIGIGGIGILLRRRKRQ